jgi:hypothetical protein
LYLTITSKNSIHRIGQVVNGRWQFSLEINRFVLGIAKFSSEVASMRLPLSIIEVQVSPHTSRLDGLRIAINFGGHRTVTHEISAVPNCPRAVALMATGIAIGHVFNCRDFERVVVPVDGLNTSFIGPGVVDISTGLDTGFAFANPGQVYAHFTVTLRTAGSSRDAYFVSPPMTLKAEQQIAQFLSQLFPGGIPPDEQGRPVHDVSIQVMSDQPLAMMLLRRDINPSGAKIYSMVLKF